MIVVDPSSPVPLFEQLRAQLAGQIHDGTLAGGERLPTVRRMAEDLGLAPNTVARTYRELEAAGLIETRGRNGTVVAWSPGRAEQELQQSVRAFAGQVRRLGVDPQEALRRVEAALRPA